MSQFHIPNMSCSACLAKIAAALESQDELAVLAADYETAILNVNTDLSTEMVQKLLADAGYPAQSV